MGCNPAKAQSSMYDSFNFTIKKMNLESFDKNLTQIENTLTEAELARFYFSSKFGAMISESGAVILKTPNLNYSLLGLIYQTARDCNAEPLTYFLISSSEKEYIKIIEGKVPSKEVLQTRTIIIKYIDECIRLQPVLKTTCTNLSNLNDLFAKSKMQWINDFNNAKKGDAKAQGEFQSYIQDINNTIITANKLCNEILASCNSVKKEVDDFLKLNTPNMDKAKLKQIFDENSKKKITDNITFYKTCVKPELVETETSWKNLKDFKIKNNKSSVKEPPKTVPVQEVKPQENIVEKKPEEPKKPEPSEEEKKKIEEIPEQIKKEEENANLENNIPAGKVYETSVSALTSWSLAQTNSLHLNTESNYPKCFALNLENSMLLFGTKNGTVHLTNLTQQEISLTLNEYDQSVRSLVYFNDSKTFLSGGKDGKLKKWVLEYEEDGETIRSNVVEIPKITPGAIRAIVSLVDGVFFYVASDKNLLLYNINSNKEVKNIPLNDDITRLLWLKDEKLVIAGLRNGNVVIVNHEKREIIRTIEDHKEKITGLAECSYNGNLAFATTSKDKSIKIYDVKQNFENKSSFTSPDSDSYPKDLIYAYDKRSFFTINKGGKLVVIDYIKTDKKRVIESNDSELTAGLYNNNFVIFSNKKGNINFFKA